MTAALSHPASATAPNGVPWPVRYFAAATPEPVDIPRDPAEEAARDELSKPMYHQDDPSLFTRVFRWLMDRFDELVDRLTSVAPGGGFGLLVVLIVAVAVVIALRLKLGPLRAARGRRREALFTAEGPRTAAQYRALADDAAARGAWEDAVQNRLRAVVRALEERAILDERPGRTADEAADEAGRQLPDLAGTLLSAALMFDYVRYGGRPGTEDMDRALRDLDTRCAAARPAREPVAAVTDRTPR